MLFYLRRKRSTTALFVAFALLLTLHNSWNSQILILHHEINNDTYRGNDKKDNGNDNDKVKKDNNNIVGSGGCGYYWWSSQEQCTAPVIVATAPLYEQYATTMTTPKTMLAYYHLRQQDLVQEKRSIGHQQHLNLAAAKTRTITNDDQQLRRKQLPRIYVYESSSLPPRYRYIRHCRMDELMEMPETTQNNFHTDMAVIHLFETYPGRTWNAEEADIFVVPYPHGSHCLSDCHFGTYAPGCPSVSTHALNHLFSSLEYFGEHPDRHLFIITADRGLVHRQLEETPLHLTIGGVKNPYYHYRDIGGGSIVVPYLNDHPRFQPSVILQRSEHWWTRPRKYSLVYFFNTKSRISGKNPRRFRSMFSTHLRKHYPNKTLGGLPYEIGDSTIHLSTEQLMAFYENSTFCPCLPGDGPVQKRFFDVIMSGCIPVVLRFRASNDSAWSWHPSFSPVVENLPSPKRLFGMAHTVHLSKDLDNDTHEGHKESFLIDYESFVLQVDVPAAYNGTLEHAMEYLLLHHPDELHRRQLQLMKYASWFSYGLGPNAHKYKDAFSQIIIPQLQEYHMTLIMNSSMNKTKGKNLPSI